MVGPLARPVVRMETSHATGNQVGTVKRTLAEPARGDQGRQAGIAAPIETGGRTADPTEVISPDPHLRITVHPPPEDNMSPPATQCLGSPMAPCRYRPTMAALLLVAVVACGGEPGPAGDTDPAKETVPLADEETSPRETMRSTTGEFNACLEASGYEFRGFAGEDLTDAAVADDPGYVEALQRCNAQTGIADLRAEFQQSRAERTPDQIRETNGQILAVVDCLRARGWEVDDPTQDETGALNLRGLLQGSDVDLRGDEEARSCLSEMRLREDG